MAELTVLDSKIGEVLGLAMAAQTATERIGRLVEDASVSADLRSMHDDATRIEELGTALISSDQYGGKKTAILEQARETKGEATEMMRTYLGEDADGLDGLEFLTMAEAGEVGHWNVVAKLNEKVGDAQLRKLTETVIPLQEKHLQTTFDGARTLAAQEDPSGPA